jgi:ectoine hydroxylase-related dioxygenase (phytanoyl-CoA dioxygenase family)
MGGTDVSEVDENQALSTKYPLTAEQVAQLHETGWVHLPGLLIQEVVEQIRAHLAETPELSRPAGFPGADSFETKTALTRREGLCWQDPFMRRIATSRRIASAVVGLMKRETALLAADMSFNKAAEGGDTKLHQDYPYYPWDRAGGLTVWIALVDMTEDMGPIQYLEGSHREGPLGFADPSVDILDANPQLRDRKIGLVPSMAAGDANVHLDLLVHGSAPNTTERDREAWAVRYMRADTVYNGVSHPHYDQFGLTAGTRFADSGQFPLVGLDGLVA